MDRQDGLRQRVFSSSPASLNRAGDPQENRSWWRFLWAPFSFLRMIFRFAWSLFSFLAPQRGVRPHAIQQRRVVRDLGELWPSEVHPQVYEGQLVQALRAANSSSRFLLLYLRNPDHHETNAVLRALSNEHIVNFIHEHFVFWTTSLHEREGVVLARKLAPRAHPFFVVMTLVEEQAFPVDTVVGHSSPDALFARLMQIVEEKGSILESLRAQNQQVEIDRSLMATQNAELEEALMADLAQKEEEKKAKEEEIRRQQQEEERLAFEESERLRIEEETRLKQLRLQEERKLKEERLPQEPRESDENVARLSFRLPGGVRLTRRFSAHQKVQSLYDYVDTKQTTFEPDTYTLFCFPRREFVDLDATLESAGLCPSSSLEVKPKPN